jgi:hypothetical protein
MTKQEIFALISRKRRKNSLLITHDYWAVHKPIWVTFCQDGPSKPFQLTDGYRNFFISCVKNYTALKKSSEDDLTWVATLISAPEQKSLP